MLFFYHKNNYNKLIIRYLIYRSPLKGWSRKKKEALINDKWELLPVLAECKNESHFKNRGFDSAQPDDCRDNNHRDFDYT